MQKKRGFLLVVLLITGFALGIGTSAFTAEKHPEIHHAQRFLADAKNALDHAAHDFKGHRVKAIEHIEQAQEELRLALEADPN
jgi:hypothetical protein